jgi:hypothetical protein
VKPVKRVISVLCSVLLCLSPVTAFAEIENIAQTSTVETSMFAWFVGGTRDQSSNASSKYLIDGDRNTSGRDVYNAKPYITLDFGEEKSFNKLVLAEKIDGNYGYVLRGFTFSGSNNNSEWTEIMRGTTVGEELVIELEKPAKYRYLRFDVTEKIDVIVNNEGRPVYIKDIEVYNVPKAPVASNVYVSKEPDTNIVRVGEILTGNYDYADANDDADTASVYTWYRADEQDFEKAVPIENASEISYELKAEDLGKYIWFSVKPGNEAAVNPFGEEVLSDAIGPIRNPDMGPLPPVAENMVVTGLLYPKETLSGTYAYYDENDDEQDVEGTVVRWLVYDNDTQDLKEVAKGSTYTITENDLGKILRFEVSPKAVNDAEPGPACYLDCGTVLQHPTVLDLEMLELGIDDYQNVTQDIILSCKGKNGSDISWKSSDSSVIAEDGTVFRGKTNQTVTLTATATYGSRTEEREFVLRVTANPSIGPSGGSGGGGGGSSGSSKKKISIVGTISEPIPQIQPVQPAQPSEPDSEPQKEDKPFDDLAQYEWAADSIEYLYENGIINGKSEGKFEPGLPVNRAELVKMIVLAFEIDGEVSETQFTDVEDDAWYAQYISYAKGANIINGYENGAFGVDDNVTREDFAVILYRAVAINGFVNDNDNVLNFTDSAEISEYAKYCVAELAAAGVITGNESGMFMPKSNASRAETAKMIHRILEMRVKNE